jgi:hypothetical protein
LHIAGIENWINQDVKKTQICGVHENLKHQILVTRKFNQEILRKTVVGK